MNNRDYPIGADTSGAPWRQEELPEQEIEVTVVICLSKTVKVKVDDYKMIDGQPDYSDCNLKELVEQRLLLPQKAFMYNTLLPVVNKQLSNWSVDEFEVIKD